VEEQLQHPWMAGEIAFIERAHRAKLPVIGVCLGAQLIAAALGGKVEAMAGPEVGWHNVRLAFPGTMDTILTGIPWNTAQFHLHGQQVTQLPPGATPLAGSKLCRHQAFRVGSTTYAFQYHFEWNLYEVGRFSNDALVEKAGVLPHDIRQQSERYFDGYRRLGDRLCHNLATYLVPIDKRVGTGRLDFEPVSAAPEAARP
jgi:GMP synthase (glutamine-hydrolysing)